MKFCGITIPIYQVYLIGILSLFNLNLLYSCPCLPLAGVALASRTGNLNTSEIITPTTPTSSGHSRLGGAPTPHLISGLACSHGMDPGKNNGGLVGLLGPPPKVERGRKKIKAENGSSLLVVPYPILASGNDQSCVTITAKEGKTYRYRNYWHHVAANTKYLLTFPHWQTQCINKITQKAYKKYTDFVNTPYYQPLCLKWLRSCSSLMNWWIIMLFCGLKYYFGISKSRPLQIVLQYDIEVSDIKCM